LLLLEGGPTPDLVDVVSNAAAARLALQPAASDLMAPKAPAADPGVAVTTAIGQAEAADDALVKAAALEPVLQLLSDPSALPAVVEHLDALFAQTGALIASVAAVAAADLTAELAGAVSTAAQLVTAFCEAGTPSKAALAACVPPLGALIGAPSPPAWSETELVESEARAALLTSACSTLHSLATLPSGRLALRTAAVAPALLALLQPALSSQPALQAHAALALSRLAESALSRATLAAPDTLPSLVGLVSTLSAPPPPTDALALRVHAKLLLLVGFCLYDACLLSPLFAAGLVDTTLKLLLPPPPPPPLEDGAEPPPEPSADALKCAAELRSNAATVLAIAGQSPAGRELVAKAGGLTILADALSPLVRADDAAGGDKAALAAAAAGAAAADDAAAALAANVTLALAHAALSAAGAAKLAALPQLIPSLAALLAPTPDGAVPGWAAVRGNACTALMHVVAAPAGRTAFLSSPASPAPPPIAEEEGEEGAATPVDAPPAHSNQSALSVVVALLAHATPATEEESAEPPPPPETDPGLLASAADILSACALDSNGCDAVVSAGGAHALLALLGGADQPPSLTEALVSAYAALAANPTACVMLRGASPPPPAEPAADDADAPPAEDAQAPPPPPSPLALVPTLLMSPSEGLCRAAASLATSACADAVNAATLVRLQTLPMLSQLAPTSSAAKGALDALCVAVPSAQLWRAGTLGTGVAIRDGFYGVTRDAQMLDVETLAKSNVGSEHSHAPSHPATLPPCHPATLPHSSAHLHTATRQLTTHVLPAPLPPRRHT
jgi:hypothetical protein